MAPTPEAIADYLAALPPDRREAVDAIRAAINDNRDPRFEEGMQYGMPAWFLPHSEYPSGYHCDPRQPLPFASVASQKRHIGIYLFCIYTDPAAKERFVREWRKSGCRLDMGAGCVRVRCLEEIPLKVIGRAIAQATVERFVRAYEASLPESTKRRPASRKAAARPALDSRRLRR